MIAFKVRTRKVDTPEKMDDWKRAMSSVPVITIPEPRPTPKPKPKKKGLFSCCGRPD